MDISYFMFFVWLLPVWLAALLSYICANYSMYVWPVVFGLLDLVCCVVIMARSWSLCCCLMSSYPFFSSMPCILGPSCCSTLYG
jgi:hypothetical protein